MKRLRVNAERFKAFSDGVFAIAITLLVLGLAVPAFGAHWPTAHELSRKLTDLWPNFVAYALSFAVIGIMWNNHAMLFRSVARIDRTASLVNLILLGITAFIPFATAVVGTYSTLPPAGVLYGATLTAASIAYNGLLAHLIRRRAFKAYVTQAALRDTVFHYRVGLATYVVALVLAFFVPLASYAIYWAITIYYFFPRGVDADLAELDEA